MSDNIIWIILFFVFIIIIGLYMSEYTPLNLNEKEKILKMNYFVENFTPSVSSSNAQSEGASGLYNWGLPEDDVYIKENKNKDKDKNKENRNVNVSSSTINEVVDINIKETCNSYKNDNKHINQVCSKCDITLNKDIDKYVLKSSVPACPDMSEFITKNMMSANPDLHDYILKSEVKPCDKVDLTNYILKSEIPACPTCPVCPECPICPVCPAQVNKKCPSISEYNITDHPNMSKYISINDVKKNYIKKTDIKNYIEKEKEKEKKYNKEGNKKKEYEKIKKEDENKKNKDNKNIAESKNKLSNYASKTINSKSELLNNNVMGFYAGDNLYAGV